MLTVLTASSHANSDNLFGLRAVRTHPPSRWLVLSKQTAQTICWIGVLSSCKYHTLIYLQRAITEFLSLFIIYIKRNGEEIQLGLQEEWAARCFEEKDKSILFYHKAGQSFRATLHNSFAITPSNINSFDISQVFPPQNLLKMSLKNQIQDSFCWKRKKDSTHSTNICRHCARVLELHPGSAHTTRAFSASIESKWFLQNMVSMIPSLCFLDLSRQDLSYLSMQYCCEPSQDTGKAVQK